MHSEDSFNRELFNALHPTATHPGAKTMLKAGRAKLLLDSLDPKLEQALCIESVRRGLRIDELVSDLLRLGLSASRRRKASAPKDRDHSV